MIEPKPAAPAFYCERDTAANQPGWVPCVGQCTACANSVAQANVSEQPSQFLKRAKVVKL